MQTKVCTVCGEDKPLVQYRKYSGRGRFGLRPLCKICQRAYEKTWCSASKEYRKITREKRKEKDKIYRIKYRTENAAKYLIALCKLRCRQNGIPFDLDNHIMDIQERINKGKCELTNLFFNTEPKKLRQYNSPSLDRINPQKGYLYQNIRVVLVAVNLMLGNWGLKKTKEIAKALLEP